MPDASETPIVSPEQQHLAALQEQAHALSADGRYAEALALVGGELSRRPGEPELLFASATVLFDWGRIHEARAVFLRAEALGLARTALYLNLAWSCQMLRLSEEAEHYARKATELEPENAAAHFGLGSVLQSQKRYPEAIASFELALVNAPENALNAAGIGLCKIAQGDFVDAETWMRRAVALAPENPQLLTNLGVAIVNQDRYAEALATLERAGALESALGVPPESISETGFTMVSMGLYPAAAEMYKRNLAAFPDPRAHGHYAFLMLALGHFREGWSQYEFRWMQEPHLSKRPKFVQPCWAGQDLSGKSILLLAEQGLGDIINFARYAVPLKAMGATVHLQVRPEILQLAQGFAGTDQVFAPPTPPPPFDYYIHLMSLPHVLGTELATVPADVPYVRVDPNRAQQWAARIGDGGPSPEVDQLRVGLAWAGNPAFPRDRFRSVPLDALSGLWEQQGVRFLSLQKPLKPGELEKFPTRTTMIDLSPELSDFADTAAAIDQLDLVICVDTAIAHLAGALGKPVWLMLPEIGDFRWLEDGRDDSPWYPTMRIFRQRKLGDWDEVVVRIKAALDDAVRTGSPAWQSAIPRKVASEPPTGSGDFTTEAGDAAAALPPDIARVTETRYGVMEYFPDSSVEARSIAWYGEFLQPQLDLLARLVRPGARVVEVGSGVGAHALALAQLVGAEGHLLLYESRPLIQRVLGLNLAANQAFRSVTTMRRDLAGPRESGAGSPTETLDELRLERLDLLKVQSAALAAAILDGASETLWRLRPLLFLAAADPVAATDLSARAKQFGYRCWLMETALFNRANFNRRETDIFAVQKAVALLAIPEEIDVAIALDGCVEVTEGHDPRAGAATAQAAASDSDAATDGGKSGVLRLLRKLWR